MKNESTSRYDDIPDEVWDWMRRQSQVLDPEDERRIIEEMEQDEADEAELLKILS